MTYPLEDDKEFDAQKPQRDSKDLYACCACKDGVTSELKRRSETTETQLAVLPNGGTDER